MKLSRGGSTDSPRACPTRRPWRRRAQRWWRAYQWDVVLALGVVAVVLGYIGFAKLPAAAGESRSPADLLYLSLQLFVLKSGPVSGSKSWQIEVARLLAPGLFFYAGVQALAALLYQRVRSLRMRRLANHVVICGLGRMGSHLARGFLQCGDQVVVIEQNRNDPLIAQCADEGAVVLVGNATDRELLRAARVPSARYLVAVCGDDGVNAEIGAQARELLRSRRARALTCFVHIVDPELCNLLAQRTLEAGRGAPFRLELFNIFDTGARALLNEFPAFEESDASPAAPHLVVVGLGSMGESLVVYAARHWYARRRGAGMRMRITIVDREAQRKAESVRVRYPQLEQAAELLPEQMEVEWPQFRQARFLFDDAGRCSATRVYVCLDDNSLALNAALKLVHRARDAAIPIVVRLTEDAGLAALLRRTDEGGGFENLHAFGLLSRTCRPELLLGGTHEILAQAIHQEYLRNQQRAGLTPESNPSMVPWDRLPERLRESNRRQADHIGAKLEAVGCGIAPLTDWDAPGFAFSPDEVELMARMEHERWMGELRGDGWTYAPGPKNPARKTHPCLVPWEELAEETKEIDRDTVRGIPAFLAGAGFQVVRLR